MRAADLFSLGTTGAAIRPCSAAWRGAAVLLAFSAMAPAAQAQPMPAAPAIAAAAPARPDGPEPMVDLPRGAVRLTTPNSLVMVTASTAPGRTPNSFSFREEGTAQDYFQENGGGSIGGSAEVDCAGRRFRLEKLTVYQRNNLTGRVVVNFDARADWREAGQTTLMGRVVDLACGKAGVGAPPPPAPPQAQPRGTTTAQAARPATPPQPPPAPRPTAAQRAAPPPALRPAQLPPTSTQPPAQPVATAPAPAAPRPAPQAAAPVAPSTASPPPSPPSGAYWVQVQASPDREEAERTVAETTRSQGEVLAGHPGQVVSATVRNRRVFRSVFGPYPDRPSATAACAALSQRGRACFVQMF